MSTHQQLLYHIIFSTKNRKPWLTDGFREKCLPTWPARPSNLEAFLYTRSNTIPGISGIECVGPPGLRLSWLPNTGGSRHRQRMCRAFSPPNPSIARIIRRSVGWAQRSRTLTVGFHWQTAVIECSIPSHSRVALADRRHQVLRSIPQSGGTGRPPSSSAPFHPTNIRRSASAHRHIQTSHLKYDGKSTGWPPSDRGMVGRMVRRRPASATLSVPRPIGGLPVPPRQKNERAVMAVPTISCL